MIGIVNKFLLAGNKFIPEMQQPGFTYSACGPFTKKKKNTHKEIQNFQETGDSQYIY